MLPAFTFFANRDERAREAQVLERAVMDLDTTSGLIQRQFF